MTPAGGRRADEVIIEITALSLYGATGGVAIYSHGDRFVDAADVLAQAMRIQNEVGPITDFRISATMPWGIDRIVYGLDFNTEFKNFVMGVQPIFDWDREYLKMCSMLQRCRCMIVPKEVENE